jgi:hypothetical protein
LPVGVLRAALFLVLSFTVPVVGIACGDDDGRPPRDGGAEDGGSDSSTMCRGSGEGCMRNDECCASICVMTIGVTGGTCN